MNNERKKMINRFDLTRVNLPNLWLRSLNQGNFIETKLK